MAILARARLLAISLCCCACEVGSEHVYYDMLYVPPAATWGEYAATLPIDACPASTHEALVVDTPAVELEGGVEPLAGSTLADPMRAGARLSLHEALWIAANREGPDTIVFDPGVFPVESAPTIFLQHSLPWPLVAEVCIDARERGVVVQWPVQPSCCDDVDCSPCVPRLQSSVVIGLTLLALPAPLAWQDTRVAACRIGSDGYSVIGGPELHGLWLSGAAMTVGPGNLFVGGALRSDAEHVEVVGSYFGFDPVSANILPLEVAVVAAGQQLTIRESVFAHAALQTVTGAGGLSIEDSHIGCLPDEENLPGSTALSVTLSPAPVTIGPGNRFAVDAEIMAGPDAPVTVTQNRFVAGADLLVSGSAPAAPRITERQSSRVLGTCDESGWVEVFHGPTGREAYLDATACDASGTWSLSVSHLPAEPLRATLTAQAGQTSPYSEALSP